MVNQLIVACIPAFNEEQNLASVVTKVSKFADKIIVCDDGSTDMTREIAVKLGCDLVVHSRRLGKGVALKDLFEKALDLEGDIIVTIDGDGQNNPDDIPALINPIFQGEVDIVVGSRFLDKSNDIPFHRVIGNNVFTSFTRLLSSENFKDLSDSQSGFRAYSRKVLEFVKIQTKGMGVDSEIIISASDSSFKITEIPIVLHKDGRVDSQKHLNTISDGISTLKFFLIFCPRILYFIPSLLIALLGVLNLFLYSEDLIKISINYSLLLFFSSLLVSIQLFMLGLYTHLIARSMKLTKPSNFIENFFKVFTLKRAVILSSLIFVIAILMNLYKNAIPNFDEEIIRTSSIFLIILSIHIFFNSMFISLISLKVKI